MRFCETNPFVMCVNADIIRRVAMICTRVAKITNGFVLANSNLFLAQFAQGDRRAATVERLTLWQVAI